jgi:hypothetical protein
MDTGAVLRVVSVAEHIKSLQERPPVKCPKCTKDLVEWPHETGGYKGVQCFKCELQWWSNTFDNEATRNEVRALANTLKYMPFPEDAKEEAEASEARECKNLISTFFKMDKLKIDYWWKAPNPGLGDVSPSDMLSFGKQKKLLRWIKTLLKENGR